MCKKSLVLSAMHYSDDEVVPGSYMYGGISCLDSHIVFPVPLLHCLLPGYLNKYCLLVHVCWLICIVCDCTVSGITTYVYCMYHFHVVFQPSSFACMHLPVVNPIFVLSSVWFAGRIRGFNSTGLRQLLTCGWKFWSGSVCNLNALFCTFHVRLPLVLVAHCAYLYFVNSNAFVIYHTFICVSWTIKCPKSSWRPVALRQIP